MLCKKRVHALFSEMIMTSLTAEFPTLQDREGTSEMGSAHAKHLDSRESKLQRPCLDFTPQFSKLFVVSSQTLFEACEFLALLLLDSQRNLATPVKEITYCLEVFLCASTCCHRRVIQFSHRQETV